MVKQLLKDGIISIDYVKSEVNLVYPLTVFVKKIRYCSSYVFIQVLFCIYTLFII